MSHIESYDLLTHFRIQCIDIQIGDNGETVL